MVEADNIFKDLPNFDGFYSKEELAGFRLAVAEKFEETKQNLEHSIEKVKNTGMEASGDTSYSLHMADQGTDAMEREKAFLFAQRDEKFLIQLENALERIKVGTFGICKSCGVKILPARLKAVPTTAICIKCKTEKESR
jgi:RNA polymerase-binding protein DksA